MSAIAAQRRRCVGQCLDRALPVTARNACTVVLLVHRRLDLTGYVSLEGSCVGRGAAERVLSLLPTHCGLVQPCAKSDYWQLCAVVFEDELVESAAWLLVSL